MRRKSRPAADIIPVETGLGHGDLLRLFHDRVIDRDFWQPGKLLQNISVHVCFRKFLDEEREFRLTAPRLAQKRVGLPAENARVPEEIPARKITFRARRVRFFDKAVHMEERARRRAFRQRLPRFQVTEAGGRMIGPDAEGHNRPAHCGEGGRLFQLRGKGRGILDQRVGGQENHHRLGIEIAHQRRAERAGGGGVPLGRLRDELLRREMRHRRAARLDLRRIGQHENMIARQRVLHSSDRLLEHRPLGQERHQMLGRRHPAQGPEPLAAAARHDTCVGIFHADAVHCAHDRAGIQSASNSSISSPDRPATKASSPMLAWNSSRLRACIAWIFSSTVPAAISL